MKLDKMPDGSSMKKLSEDQKNILIGAFERFPNPDYHSEALRMVSDKTGLSEGVIKKWFQKRREALCKNMKTSDEEDVQILNNTEPDDDLDFVEIDEASDKSTSLVKTQSSNSNSTLSNEDKAAEYDNLKIQMENLKKQMLQMSHSLDQRDQQLQPSVHPHVRYQHHQPQHHYQHQFLPYPAQEYSHGYHQPISFPYNPYSPWHLPYPPPEFKIIFLNPPPVLRNENKIEKETESVGTESNEVVTTASIESADLTKEPNHDDEKSQKKIVLEEPPCEKIPERSEELVDIVDNFEKQVQEEIVKDNLKIDVTPMKKRITPMKKRINDDLDMQENLKKRYRLPPTPYKVNSGENQKEIADKSIEESLAKAQQEIDEFEKMLDEVDPIDKDTQSMSKGDDVCIELGDIDRADPNATQNLDDEDGDVLDESVILESEIERTIENGDGSSENTEEIQITLEEEPSMAVVNPPDKNTENLVTVTATLDDKVATNLNLSFDEALNITPVSEEKDVEVEPEPPAIEFLGEDAPSTSQQQSRPPIPFIVKQEPQEARKVGRRALANKTRSGVYQKPASPTPPPLVTPAQPRQESGPSRPQQPLVQPQQQQPRFIKVTPPTKKPTPLQHPILQQQQRRAAPSKVTFPQDQPPAKTPLDQYKTQRQPQPPRGTMNVPTSQVKRKPPNTGGRARSKSQRMQQPQMLPGMVGAGITVTKVVEPPAPPPPKQRQAAAVNPAARPELQRILGMRNLSVSINRN